MAFRISIKTENRNIVSTKPQSAGRKAQNQPAIRRLFFRRHTLSFMASVAVLLNAAKWADAPKPMVRREMKM